MTVTHTYAKLLVSDEPPGRAGPATNRGTALLAPPAFRVCNSKRNVACHGESRCISPVSASAAPRLVPAFNFLGLTRTVSHIAAYYYVVSRADVSSERSWRPPLLLLLL